MELLKKHRVFGWMLGGLLCLCLCACSGKAAVPIESRAWELTNIQSAEDGSIIAYGPDSQGTYPGARERMLSCKARDGELTIADAGGHTWKGSYSLRQGGASAIYQVTFGADADGHAVTGVTKYMDGSGEETLILSLGDFILHFRFKPGGQDASLSFSR